MKITIVGPRSVGKTTIAKMLARKLRLPYISSDEMGEKAMRKYGGLDAAIKSGIIKKFIKKSGYSIIRRAYKKDEFVFDLSGEPT
jgi:adenylate kinase family enzyme